MPASMNIQPGKRTDAKGLAAHAYRHGHIEADRIDLARLDDNRHLYGPATFEGARALINEIPRKQPNGRAVRADANVMAFAVFTFPEELADAQLEAWAETTVQWLREKAPGKLLYATLHMDEKRPHIHAGIAALEPDGKVNYQTTWGGPKKVAAERMRGLQASYAEAIRTPALKPQEAGREYDREAGGMAGFRKLRERTAQAEAVKTQDQVADLSAELQAAKNLAQQQAEQLRQWQASQDEARRQAEEREEKRKAAEEKAREAAVKQRDQEWREHLKKQRDQVAGDIDRLELPAAKVLETGGGYRERISGLFIDWRAKLLNYVADLKKLLRKEQRDSQELRERWESVMANTRPYREAVGLMNQDQRDNLDAGLEKFTAQTKEARAQAREQKRAQEQDRDGPVFGR